MIIPKPLKPGDTIAMIGVSGAIRDDDLDGAVRTCAARLEGLGFRVKIDPSVYGQYGYLSGTDRERADALNRAFADDSVDGVWCIRGGYGCIRMLDMIDWEMIARHPKAFIGYSDITTLHTVLHERCGLCTFHGPMPVTSYFDGPMIDSLMHAITGHPDHALVNLDGSSLGKLRGGTAEGMLVGGNLSLITGTIGTPYELDTKDRILFIEEIGERTYCVDRMMTQQRLAGKFEDCAGIVFGDFNDCPVEYPEFGLTLEEVIRDIAAPCGKPIFTGLQAGHVTPKLTLPLGTRCRMDAGSCTLEILESAVLD